MLSLIRDFLDRFWFTMCELAPWLLLGMLISGLLHVLLPKHFIRRRFRGKSGVVQSVLLGVPLPLCSCGVVPAGIGLKNDGASDGAAVGFLISTPQTGVDSILVSASFFGWPFAVFKMIAAAVTGIVGGWLTEWSSASEPQATSLPVVATTEASGSKLFALAEHAIEILRSIWVWLLIGVVVSAAIGTFGLESLFQRVNSAGLLASMLVMLLISVPLYVCATASVPIAAALVAGGLPPAVALVFLMAGPATNVTTIGAIADRFGKKVLLYYLLTIVIGSFVSAFLFDWLLTASVVSGDVHHHHHQAWWSILSAIVLSGLILFVAAKGFFGSTGMVENISLELDVDGIHCHNCESKIEKAIGAIDGVHAVSADASSNKVRIAGEVSRERILQVLSGIGFSERQASS